MSATTASGCATARKSASDLYPDVEVTPEMAEERPDLRPYVGRKLKVSAWLWTRTVKSPNPAFSNVDVPLASTFMLSTKAGKEAYVQPVIEGGGYRFTVKVGSPHNPEEAKNGTKLSRGANFRCVMSDMPISGDHVKAEGVGGRLGARLMAIVAERDRGRVYLAPNAAAANTSEAARPDWKPDTPLPNDPRNFWTPSYGLTTFGDLFTPRQLVALTTFSDLISEAREQVKQDALFSDLLDDGKSLETGGTASLAYADAIAMFLAFVLDRCTDFSNSCTRWIPGNEKVVSLFAKQAIA